MMNEKCFLEFINTAFDIYEIKEKKQLIGFLHWNNLIKKWVFFPEKDFYYLPNHLGVILSKMNYLNGYKKEDKK